MYAVARRRWALPTHGSRTCPSKKADAGSHGALRGHFISAQPEAYLLAELLRRTRQDGQELCSLLRAHGSSLVTAPYVSHSDHRRARRS